MRIMSRFKRLVLIFFHVIGGRILSSISFPLLLGAGGCFGMLTFSHDTLLRGKFPKMRTPTLLAFSSCDTLTRTKKPQKLEHVKCLVESSATGFTQIRPALNKRPYSIEGGGLRLYSTHRKMGDLWNVPYLTQFLHLQRRKPTFDTLCNV
jgi:hypothetical protein